MTRFFGLGTLMLALMVAVPAKAQYTVTVYPSIGPNGNGSPSINTYGANAITALETGASTAGTPGTPGYYSQVPKGSYIPPSSIIATGPTSWNGVANPTGAFAGQVGNNLFFGVAIKSNSASPFTPTAADLAYNLSTSATNAGFNAKLSGTLAGRTYGPFLVGFNGSTPIPAGTPVQGTPVTAIYWAGPSASFAVPNPAGLPAAIASLNAQFSTAIPAGGGPGNSFGNNSLTSNAAFIGSTVPEPSSVVVLALGVVGLLGYTRNRRRRVAPLPTAC
jgi:PEP-CTERM motif